MDILATVELGPVVGDGDDAEGGALGDGLVDLGASGRFVTDIQRRGGLVLGACAGKHDEESDDKSTHKHRTRENFLG